MKILSISTDRKIFKKNSVVRQRMIEYGTLFEELHIIVFTSSFLGFRKEKISDNVWIYPTNSFNRWFYIFQAIKIGQKIKNIDLITAQDPFEAGLVAYFLARKKRIKIQYQIHTDFLSPFFKKESIMNKIRIKIANFLIPKSNGLRVVSERIKRSILAKYARAGVRMPISVLPIFVEIAINQQNTSRVDCLKNKYPQFDFIILMASRLEKEKNINLAIDVIKKVLRVHQQTGLIIVGKGSQRRKLENKVKELNIQDNVIFEDWNNKLEDYYKSADLFLSTSNYEGYGLTLLEAASFGCPIATTNVGLVGEVINKDNAFVCPVGDNDCLIKSILTAINNNNLRKALGLKAQDEVVSQNITKEEYLKKYFQSYQNL